MDLKNFNLSNSIIVPTLIAYNSNMEYKETWLVVYIAFDSIFYAYLVPILKLI